MNNQRYLGSALYIIDLDFNYKFQKEMEHEFETNSVNKNSKVNKKGSEREYSLPQIK